MRSKAALLLALVAKRQGPQLWAEVLPRLVAVAQEGPLQAEMVRPGPSLTLSLFPLSHQTRRTRGCPRGAPAGTGRGADGASLARPT